MLPGVQVIENKMRRRDLGLGLFSLAISGRIARADDSKVDDLSSDDALQTWITKSAVTVRSIDAADEDFEDLEPLIDAIGSARVVQLGEPSHGAGTSFAAKVRLIKFLHRRMGFDVVVWESGFYDLELTQAGMRAGEDAVAAARRGIFTLWSNAEEVRPLFEYAKASQTTTSPLDMAGFDMQVTADGSMERFATDLRSFVAALGESALRARASELANQAIEARGRVFSAMQAEDLESLRDAAAGLLSLIRNKRAAFEEVHGSRTSSFMEHAIENMRIDAVNRYDAHLSAAPNVERENRRDALNASNLHWLIQDGYPGRKIIVWAHNVHVMNAYYSSDWRTVHLEPQPTDMKPSGVFLAEWLKDGVYTIGMTTYQGQDGLAIADVASPIDPADAGSLESRLHRLGKPYVFLDVRSVRGSHKHPLHTRQSMRIPKYDNNSLPDLTKAFGAIFYIDHMAPATRIS
jgi:erythromycin esterase